MAAPNFNGDDAKGWKQRCEEFFLVDETPDNRKVMYAAIKFEGRALHWHQLYAKTSGKSLLDMSWDDYSRATLLHFGEEPELEDELLQIQKALSNLQLALARVEEDVSRLQKQSLMIHESSNAIELAECEEKSETEGIHSQTDYYSSLCYDISNSVSFGTEIRTNFEVEYSAHQVFDEMPDRNLFGIEVGFSDMSLCRTILSNNTVGFVDKDEVRPACEINACKVFDVSPEGVGGESNAEIKAQFNVKSGCGSIHDVIVILDDSSNLVLKHLTGQIGGSSQDVLVKVSCGKVMNFQFFSDIVCFWGQKSFKEGVLGKEMDIGSFGWKPGWITFERNSNEVQAVLSLVVRNGSIGCDVSDGCVSGWAKLQTKHSAHSMDFAKQLLRGFELHGLQDLEPVMIQWVSNTNLGIEGSFVEGVNAQGFSGKARNDKVNSNEKFHVNFKGYVLQQLQGEVWVEEWHEYKVLGTILVEWVEEKLIVGQIMGSTTITKMFDGWLMNMQGLESVMQPFELFISSSSSSSPSSQQQQPFAF